MVKKLHITTNLEIYQSIPENVAVGARIIPD